MSDNSCCCGECENILQNNCNVPNNNHYEELHTENPCSDSHEDHKDTSEHNPCPSSSSEQVCKKKRDSSSSSDSSSSESDHKKKHHKHSDSEHHKPKPDDCDKDKKRFRYYKKCKQVLALSKPTYLCTSHKYLCLYEKLYKAILDNYLEVKLKELLEKPSQELYDAFVLKVFSCFCINTDLNKAYKHPSLRIVVTEPDGTVVIDSYKPLSENTYYNWKTKAINENHNSRVAIMDAQNYDCGVGYEKKHSSTMDNTQYYVAVRAGLKYKNYGTFRLSKMVSYFVPT